MQKKRAIVVLAAALSMTLVMPSEGKGGRGGSSGAKYKNRGSSQKDSQQGARSGSQEKQSKKPTWSPTSWQKTLPAVVVREGGREKTYEFEKLILADGYLCPGSAMAYQTLRTALPILYGSETPRKGDFSIVYGPSDCAQKVFNYFMGKSYRASKYLRPSGGGVGRQHVVIRLSTGKKVRISYAPPAADGHNPAAAEAADAILKATDGSGMTVETAGAR